MKKLFFSLLAVAALCACSNKEQVPSGVNPAAGTAIRFAAHTYSLKSSDTGLDAGDKVGIFALAPINRQNVEATVAAGGALEIPAANTIYWGKDQTEQTDFVAYYPYMDGVAYGTPVHFAVQADQSSAAAYQASDLMGGGAKSAPTTAPIEFELSHLLSKVVVNVDNKIATETVASVALDKLVIDADLAVGSDDFTLGTTEAIQKALRPDATKDSFELIVMPQQAQPKLVVTMASGKTYTFSLAAKVNFKQGKKATADVEITAAEPSANPVSFSFSVKNWEADDPLVFANPEEGTSWVKEDNKWAVIGLNGDWDHDVYMTQGVDGGGLEEWSVTLTYNPATTEKIKLRYNNDFADGDFGASNSDPSVTIVPLNVKTDYNLVAGGADFSINVTAATEVSIYFRPSDGHLWLQADVTSGGGDPVDPTAKADLYVINGPAWDAPVVWAWGASVVMPGDWPNGLAPVGVENIGGKDYVHFELDSSYIGTIGFLIVNNQALPAPQTVNADDVIVKNGDKLYYEVGTVADGTGKYPLTPVL